jgi:DNA topoisomerase-1
MAQYFADIVDLKFTARMEEDLDMIASGQAEWVEVMHEFYHPFAEDVKKAQAEMPVTKSEPEPIGRKCPEDGGELVIRYGRFGKFISCSNFPTCRTPSRGSRRSSMPEGRRVCRYKTATNILRCEVSNTIPPWKRPIKVPCPNAGLLVMQQAIAMYKLSGTF